MPKQACEPSFSLRPYGHTFLVGRRQVAGKKNGCVQCNLLSINSSKEENHNSQD